MHKKIMILGASVLQLPAIIEARKMGYEVVVVDMNPLAIGFKEPNIIKEIISTIDEKAILYAAKKHRIDGIMTLATDLPIRSVALIAKELNLVGISEETALKATNKYEMRMALKQYGVPIPKFYKASNYEEYIQAIKNLSTSFIVKPVDNSGSRGIYLVKDIENKEELLTAYKHSVKNSRNGDILIEEYMIGPEVSVETLSINGICNVIQVTDKLTTGSPYFVEMGHSQPSKLNREIINKVKETAIAANKAIGIEVGPSHTEIIVTSEGPKIVELGARLGGDCITTHLIPLSTGINLVKCCIEIAMGKKVNIKHLFERASAIRYINQKPGVINSIIGIDEAKNVNGIRQISIVHGVGEKITEVIESGSRMGFVIAQDDNQDLAIKDCEEALRLIRVEYKN